MLHRCLPLAFAALLVGTASAKMSLPFIENDFEKAMAAAKSQQRPIFVEVWAPW